MSREATGTPQTLTPTQEASILNLQAMTECTNKEEMEDLLKNNKWDESLAAQEYFALQTMSAIMQGSYNAGTPTPPVPNTNTYANTNTYMGPGAEARPMDEYRSEALIPDYGYMRHAHGGGRGNYGGEEISIGGALVEGIKTIGGGVKSFWNMAIPKFLRGLSPGGEEFIALFEKKFKKVAHPNFIHGTLEEAAEKAKSQDKPLFLYIHNCNKAGLGTWLREVIGSTEIIDILREGYVSLGLDERTKEGKRMINRFEVHELPYMAVIHSPRAPGVDIRTVVLEYRTGIEIALSQVVEFLTTMIDTRNIIKSEDLVNLKPEEREDLAFEELLRSELTTSGYPGMDYNRVEEEKKEIIKPYDEDLKERKQLQREKEIEEERRQKEEMERVREEELKIIREKEEKIIREEEEEKGRMLKLKTRFEVEETGEDVGVISFRTPGGMRLTHKFNKNNKIQVLFEYVESLDLCRTEGMESNIFDLIQPPIREPINPELTIEEAHLFPNSHLVIKPN